MREGAKEEREEDPRKGRTRVCGTLEGEKVGLRPLSGSRRTRVPRGAGAHLWASGRFLPTQRCPRRRPCPGPGELNSPQDQLRLRSLPSPRHKRWRRSQSRTVGPRDDSIMPIIRSPREARRPPARAERRLPPPPAPRASASLGARPVLFIGRGEPGGSRRRAVGVPGQDGDAVGERAGPVPPHGHSPVLPSSPPPPKQGRPGGTKP